MSGTSNATQLDITAYQLTAFLDDRPLHLSRNPLTVWMTTLKSVHLLPLHLKMANTKNLDSDECEAKTYARKRYTESQSSIYARSSGSEVVSNAHWLS